MAKKEWLAKGVDGLSFGERLGDLIAKKGITQAELAKSTGIGQSRLSDYITGKEDDSEKGTRIYAAPDCATVITLAKYFSVSTDYLLGLTGVPTPKTDIRATAELTGLSSKNIERLAFWKKEAIYPGFFYVLNSFLNDPRFYTLMDKIIRYLDKKTQLEAEVARYKETKHLTSEELRVAEELTDVAYLHMYRSFDMLIDCLKYHYKNPCSTEGSAINGND